MTTLGAESGAPGHPNVHARVSPLSAEAFAVQFTRSREADERFRRAQDLLGHQVASNDIAEVYDRAVRELIKRLEKARFAACEKPRNNGRGTRSGSRHISNEVQREGAASAGLSQGSVPHRRGALPGHGGRRDQAAVSCVTYGSNAERSTACSYASSPVIISRRTRSMSTASRLCMPAR